MNTSQSNILTMYKAVIANFNSNTAAWASIKPLAEEVQKLIDLKTKIENLALQKRSSSTKGYTSEKDAKITQLIAALEVLTKRVSPYANKTKKLVLKESINYSKSKLKGLSQENLLPVAKSIIDAVKVELPNLVDYKVTSEQLDNIKSLIGEASTLISTRDNIGDNSTTVTKLLKAAFKEGTILLKDIDDMVESMVEDTTFQSTHTNSRSIEDRGGSGPSKDTNSLKE